MRRVSVGLAALAFIVLCVSVIPAPLRASPSEPVATTEPTATTEVNIEPVAATTGFFTNSGWQQTMVYAI